ncbi:hypothetical protein ACFX1X_028405 [Malus domestica]
MVLIWFGMSGPDYVDRGNSFFWQPKLKVHFSFLFTPITKVIIHGCLILFCNLQEGLFLPPLACTARNHLPPTAPPSSQVGSHIRFRQVHTRVAATTDANGDATVSRSERQQVP